ncbi:phosphoribosyltransferase [Modestobacter lapidis]|nr:phosphoribosyltransferase [Modestobacter lapidis]
MSPDQKPFADRREAGRVLADRLSDYAHHDVVVLGLPRGGVPVAAEVAAATGGALDVLIVRKLGLPGQPELAMGAIAAVGDAVETVRNQSVIEAGGVDESAFEAVRQRESDELRRRTEAYRGGRAATPVHGRAVIVVDDGLATGSTMRAALAAVRKQQPRRLTVAVPVASGAVCDRLAAEVDEVVCVWTPEFFSAVGQGYTDFSPTQDDEVRAALAAAAGSTGEEGRADV